MLESLGSYGPFLGIVTLAAAMLWAAYWLLISRHPDIGNERMFSRQLIMLGLMFFALLVCIVSLPVSDSSRNQLIWLIGILISGVFAFSSTTVISNLMAGVLLRLTKPFRVGDFIRIGEHFGRVSERGLFDTEIQTETRELVALPNTYCISNPVATIRSSGTIISASLSLGYDIDHRRIEPLLVEAAQSCGLAEPFVHILELGSFSVAYRVSGFLEEPKRLLSVRSSLYASVLDTLHSQGIEIMSPAFMNQRQLREDARAIPATTAVTGSDNKQASAEAIAFDKAEQAEELENEKRKAVQEIEKLEAALKQAAGEDEKKAGQEALERVRDRLKSLEARSARKERGLDADEPGAAPDGHSG